MFKFSNIFAIGLTLLASACVVPFEIDVPSEKTYLVVEATLNDVDTEQTISIHQTYNIHENTYNAPESGLKAEIIVNNSEIITLTEKGKGIYALPSFFRVQPGATYRLRFQKTDGTLYESSEEKTSKAPAIERTFDEFEADGIKGGTKNIPANFVYVDFKDNPEEKNFYTWTWKLWEKQTICLTNYYDFYCNSQCWEILSNKEYTIFSDAYTNGKSVYGKLVAKIPYYSFDGALIEIKQHTVSEQVYKYFKLLSDQLQSTGSLVDTPPAAIVGNIKNINNINEPIGGVFSVTSVVTQRYWLNRENGYGKAVPVSLLGRLPLIAPNSLPYPCIEGPTRTPKKPEGWVD